MLIATHSFIHPLIPFTNICSSYRINSFIQSFIVSPLFFFFFCVLFVCNSFFCYYFCFCFSFYHSFMGFNSRDTNHKYLLVVASVAGVVAVQFCSLIFVLLLLLFFFLFNFTRLFYNSCYLEVLILPLLYLKQEPGQPTITTNLLKPHLILIIWLYRIEFLLYRRLFVCLCAYFIENIGIIFLVFFSSFILWLLFAESMHEIWNNCIQIYLFMPVKSIIFYHKH